MAGEEFERAGYLGIDQYESGREFLRVLESSLLKPWQPVFPGIGLVVVEMAVNFKSPKCAAGPVYREDVEVLKQFRANPVPVKTFLPLYESMSRRQRLKGEVSTMIRKARHEAEQKPFHFSQMNYEIKSCAPKVNESEATGVRTRSKSCSRIVSSGVKVTAISPKMTRATLLRNLQCRNNLDKATHSDFRQTVFDVKGSLAHKLHSYSDKVVLRERLKKARMEQRCRVLEYEKEVEEMNERVKNRPLLLERQSQEAAVAKLQREFENMLKEEGLNEKLIKKCNEKCEESVESSATSSSLEYESDDEPQDGESEKEVSDDATY